MLTEKKEYNVLSFSVLLIQINCYVYLNNIILINVLLNLKNKRIK